MALIDQDLGLQLLEWAQAWPRRQWAVEGATGPGRGVAQLLAAAAQSVLDVPAKLAARAPAARLWQLPKD